MAQSAQLAQTLSAMREGAIARSTPRRPDDSAAPPDVAHARTCVRGERREPQNSQGGTLAGRIGGR